MSFKSYSEKSKAKRALAKFGENVLAKIDTLLHMGDDGTGAMKWGFDEADVEAVVLGFDSAQHMLDEQLRTEGAALGEAVVNQASDTSDDEPDVTPVASGNMFANMGAALTGSQVIPQASAAAVQTRAASKSSYTIEKDRPEQNGIKRPSAGGLCRAVWDACDDIRTANNGTPPTSKQVKEEAAKRGWNPNNATIEFYQWRKYNGITGRTAKTEAVEA